MATENESELVETSRVASAQQQKQQQPKQDVKVVPAAVLARQAKLEKLQKSGKPGPVSKRPRQFYPSVSNYNPQSAETATSITAAESKASEDKTTTPKRVLPVLFSGIHDEHESVELETEPAHGAYQPIMIDPQEETEPDYEQIPAQPAADPESATAVSSQQDSFAAILSKHELGRNSRKRHRLHDGDDAAAAQSAAEVIDFSVDDFYERNREANELEGNKPANVVRAIGGGKHQLSSLLRSAQNNREGLEEMFLQNKRTKKESGSKYGF